ncbi:hypothetical protein RUMLAC_01037 [[Ruminococcus] lactaris ATCC 29176]|uniref:Uncharacterized protein n=1 Tax=[Ruminococcus] lactaris ATCC 29176 TaxID=471875 RepID=B5CNK1_9FIRM|nr:hypothetical protein RUMLAC_01037 [[Ruminococcus] lactaris ATCC 29176]
MKNQKNNERLCRQTKCRTHLTVTAKISLNQYVILSVTPGNVNQ